MTLDPDALVDGPGAEGSALGHRGVAPGREASAFDTAASTPLLAVIILTCDEEKNLPVALASLAGLGAAVFVVDSGSTDRTVEIARAAGCEVVTHAFTSHARQLNWALANLPLLAPWVLRLDADERLTPELAAELRATLPVMPAAVGALMMKRRVYFWGRWIRHGGYYPTWLVRVWRNGAAVCEDRQMDEHMLVKAGSIGRLEHDIVDENQKGLGFWIDKHNRYADKEVASLVASRAELSAGEMGAATARKRFLKTSVYGRAPRFFRAFLYWAYRYFIRLGFLDGRPGLVFHFLQGFWYRLLVDAKLTETEMKRPRE